MLAIAFLLAFIVYLLISGLLAWAITTLVWKYGKKGWAFYLTVLLLMLAPLFWDWPLMEISHRYKCIRHAGFEVYTTLDEWKRKNPGVAETLTPVEGESIRIGNATRYQLNQRFAWDIIGTSYWFHIYKKDERIIDTKTGELMARYVDFGTTIPPLGWGGSEFSDYKVWMRKRSCEKSSTKPSQKEFRLYKYLIKHQKEYEQ